MQYELKVVVEELEITKKEHPKGFVSVSKVTWCDPLAAGR